MSFDWTTSFLSDEIIIRADARRSQWFFETKLVTNVLEKGDGPRCPLFDAALDDLRSSVIMET
jgi:hypothetical protein